MKTQYYGRYTVGLGITKSTPHFDTEQEVVDWIEKDQKLWCVYTVYKVEV
jgi:hypothetical protein